MLLRYALGLDTLDLQAAIWLLFSMAFLTKWLGIIGRQLWQNVLGFTNCS